VAHALHRAPRDAHEAVGKPGGTAGRGVGVRCWARWAGSDSA
jgi:hypothetical protein